MNARAAIIGAILVASCSSGALEQEIESTRPTTIRLEQSECYEFCPSFVAEVNAQGAGTFEGRYFVASRGDHTFTVTPEEFANLVRRLAPFRPASSVGYDRQHCEGPIFTDSPSVSITWTDADGQAVTFSWAMGCQQPGLAENSDAIYYAWQELSGLAELVGAEELRPTFEGY